MPPIDQRLVEKEGGIRNPTWLEERPGLSNMLNAFGEAFGVFPSRRIWREVVKAWEDRDKKIDVLPSAGKQLDKAGGMLSDILSMASPGMDAADLGKMALLYAPFKGKATPGSNAFSALWDKKPRVEISDDAAKLNISNLSKNPYIKDPDHYQVGLFDKLKLKDVLDHPELYKQFPEAGDIDVGSTGFSFGTSGSFDEAKNKMRLAGAKSKDMLETIGHETEHYMQGRGGLARGGNVSMYLPENHESLRKDVTDRLKFIHEKWRADVPAYNSYLAESTAKDLVSGNKGFGYDEGIANYIQNTPEYNDFVELLYKKDQMDSLSNTAFGKYKKTAGEFEARDAASRMNLTPMQRITTAGGGKPPYSSEPEIKLSDLIVRMEPGSGRAMMNKGKKK